MSLDVGDHKTADRIVDHRKGLFVTLAVMYFACGFVAQFAAQGVGLFLRESGATSGLIGLLYVAAVPYTLRFVWAPVVDRVRPASGPRFKPWIIGSQVAVCCILLGLGFLDPAQSGGLIVLGIALLMIALGTQTVALGGLMVEGLAVSDYSNGATVKAAASAVAGLVLGTFVIYMLGDLGWQFVVFALLSVAFILLITAVFILDFGPQIIPSERPGFLSQFNVFRRKGPQTLFVMSILLSSAVLLPYASKAVLLIDVGFSVAQGGLIAIVIGSFFGVLGALTARLAIGRFGAFNVLIGLGAANVLVSLALALVICDTLSVPAVVSGVLWANFAVFATFTANRSLLMPLCQQGRQASEMATFASLEAVVFLLIAGAALSLLDTVGLSLLLLTMAVVSAIGLIFVRRVAKVFEN
ncbi:hypothetical protein [Pseudaestuariivita rosea]|uniref:hypothetical protein n=1 Tax=Pseudaestuariivita rosea TaxID=2763263 RepID=UPI001ABAC5D4|nr:hypothetical protein [Pseudaestuariivita rosea]